MPVCSGFDPGYRGRTGNGTVKNIPVTARYEPASRHKRPVSTAMPGPSITIEELVTTQEAPFSTSTAVEQSLNVIPCITARLPAVEHRTKARAASVTPLRLRPAR